MAPIRALMIGSALAGLTLPRANSAVALFAVLFLYAFALGMEYPVANRLYLRAGGPAAAGVLHGMDHLGAAVAAWIGGVLWLAMRVRPARVATLVAAVCLAAAAWRVEGIGRGGLAAAALGGGGLVSGLLVGLTVHAMLLGHWYLNAPGMRVDILDRMVRWTLLAWALAAALATAGLPSLFAEAGDPPTIALAGLRWLSGLVGLPILLVMSRRTLEIPNTQSATGILYVACLAAVSGELTAQLLAERAGWPL